MENDDQIASESPSGPELEGLNSPSVDSNHDLEGLDSPSYDTDHGLLAELESLRESHRTLQSKSEEMEETLILTNRQKDDAFIQITNLSKIIEELSRERDRLLEEDEESLRVREEEFEGNLRDREAFLIEIEVYREKLETLEKDREERTEFLSEIVESIRALKFGLVKLIENVDEERSIEEVDGEITPDSELDTESSSVMEEIGEVKRLVGSAESKIRAYKEMRKKEKKQLENSVVSLTEENRDVSSLLRIALVEKEAVEKSFNKVKGHGEQKRGALLSFSGLQRVGFGFMMGSGGSMVEGSGAPDGSECEEEVVSLSSTVEKIMKNLRLEISQLRKSLEDTRSDNERLQSLADKQGQEIAEHMVYIKGLEERESLLAQNVEELLYEIKDVETEVARWREACELEVEAGKNEIAERDQVVLILQQELEKTRATLEISNGKLKLKEDLAAAAMAAQAAAEASLRLTDSRAAGIRERIEEQTRQLEEAENRERRKSRHICWPWRVLKLNPPDVKRMLPEMQALLHYSM